VNPTQVYDKGPLPANPQEDEQLPAELKQLKSQAEQLVAAYMQSGEGVPASSLYDASVFHSTGEEDKHTHDSQISIMCSGFNRDAWQGIFKIDCGRYFDDPAAGLAPTAESIIIAPSIAQPRSEGSVTIQSADMSVPPKIDCNYLSDPHDMQVLKESMRHAHKIASAMDGVGSLHVPADVAKRHNGSSPFSDAVLEDWICHYTSSYHHASCTCRIGQVVDPRLKVMGVKNLRVADASVMPNIVSGNTQGVCYMIGEKAATMLAEDHGLSVGDAAGSSKCRCSAM